jgi:HEAT repeat protein
VAVPALRSTLNPVFKRRFLSANYLVEMGQMDADLIPIFIETLTNRITGFRCGAAYSLSCYGSSAQAAVPALLQALNDRSDLDVQQAALHALRRIDPDALIIVPQ